MIITTKPLAPRLLFAGLLLLTAFSTACNKGSNQPAQATSPAGPSKRYHLKGKVVSIDQSGKMADVDSEAIPDFMGAMTMPYKVKPESELEKLKPGDAIAADIVVQDDNYWLENIVVTGSGATPAAKNP